MNQNYYPQYKAYINRQKQKLQQKQQSIEDMNKPKKKYFIFDNPLAKENNNAESEPKA